MLKLKVFRKGDIRGEYIFNNRMVRLYIWLKNPSLTKLLTEVDLSNCKMKNVGVFYHPSFSRKSYMTVGNRLRDFPEVLEPLLQRPNVRLFEAPRVSEELILKVHDPAMLELVARDGFCSTAYESAGSVVAGMTALAQGEIDRAFCFIGAGGHHAGYRQFWGACCFNDVVIALTHTREISRFRRFAIVDTDAHHADGTSQLIREDPEVFLLCFCGVDYRGQGGNEVDVDVHRLDGPPTPIPSTWRRCANTCLWSHYSSRTSSSGTTASTPTRRITAPWASPKTPTSPSAT